MFKTLFKKLKQLFKSKRTNVDNGQQQNTCKELVNTYEDTNINLSKSVDNRFEEFADNLSSAMNGFSMIYKTPAEVINEYLEKYSKESLFEALAYIFVCNNESPAKAQTSCSLIRYSRDQLCEILLDLNITPIHTWLKILSHNYNSELYYEDFTLKFLCDNIPEDDLIPFVLEDFENILKRTESFDYHYFTKYEAWKQKFSVNISTILEKTHFYSATDCLELVKIFPESTINIYMFVLKKYHKLMENGKLSGSIWSKLSIVDDVLQPLADYQYLENSTPSITEEFAINFISALDSNFLTIINVKQIFEESFNINPKVLDTLVKSNVRRYINKLMSTKVSVAKNYDALMCLFAIPYGYTYFMDNIEALLHCQGIELYAFLIQHFKVKKEIINAEYCCFEYND